MKVIFDLPAEWLACASLFVALGDPVRQRILLAFEPSERLNILQIVAASTLSRTAVTHHLRVLQQSGALKNEKIGKEVFFWVDKPMILEHLKAVTQFIETQI